MNPRIGTNFRLYTFINFYLSSIQQGIQSAHIVSELFTKYPQGKTHNITINGQAISNAHFALNKWAHDDKTIIVLNGGTSFDIRQDYITVSKLCRLINEKLDNEPSQWNRFYSMPHVAFYEDHNALGEVGNGLMTGFGVVVPEQIWDAKEQPPRQVGWAVEYDYSRPQLAYQFTRVGVDHKITESVSFWEGEPQVEFIRLLKSKPLAR